MEVLGLLADGFLISFEPLNLGLVIFGAAVGLFIGAMPGLGSVNGVAILLPMTFLVPPTSATPPMQLWLGLSQSIHPLCRGLTSYTPHHPQ